MEQEGTFGWGDPRWSRPKVEILHRGPSERGPQHGQRAMVEVELGFDPNLRLRFSFGVSKEDTAEVVRHEAAHQALQWLSGAHEHFERLLKSAAEEDVSDVWGDAVMKLKEAREAALAASEASAVAASGGRGRD